MTDRVEHIAPRLVGSEVAAIELIGGGRNGRVYRVTTCEGRRAALKAYFRDPSDARDRLAAEYGGLSFLRAQGVLDVPQPLAAARDDGYALYEWIDGAEIPVGSATVTDVDAAVAFVGALRRLRHAAGSRMLPVASEACFSGDALVANLATRLARLRDGAAELADTGVMTLVSDELMPALHALAGRSREQLDFARELSWGERTLSPSDFGFHNALRVDGRLVFLDFEYFGWDDPAKTIADFVLHPAMQLPEALGHRFAAGVFASFTDDDPELPRRVAALYPLYGLKWCVILLNEFLPESLSRRRFAGVDAADATLRAAQLEKARGMLRRVLATEERFTHAG